MNKKAFTLIELLAVLVVLAILALISIPITIRIINSARENSAKRSIQGYARAVENYIGNYLINNEGVDYKNISYDMIKDNVNYSGSTVTCGSMTFQENGDLVLRYCRINNSKLYKYINRQVVEDSYEIGDNIKVNGIEFYIINNVPNGNYVVALKAEPLTVAEVNLYGGVGTANNHVNQYTYSSQGTAYDNNGYGGMAYYSSSTCKIVLENNSTVAYYDQCSNDYDNSEIKYVVDNWESVKFPNNELIEINGKTTRLISYSEYRVLYNRNFNWRYGNYEYWTMTPYQQNHIETVGTNGSVGRGGYGILNYNPTVRPVINVKKDAIN